MSYLVIISMAFGLAMDAFAVAVTVGIILPTITPRHYFRLSFHFGLFQALMPVIGWAVGNSISKYIDEWDHWIAFALLAYIGGKMIYESFHRDENQQLKDPTKGIKLVELSVATSIDAFAVGLSLALIGVEIITPVLMIGFITMILTLMGMKLGQRVRSSFSNWAEKIGGVILIGIGLKILLENLLQ